MKLLKKLSFKQFILSQASILIVGLIFLGGLYYILNVQYQSPQKPFLKGPVTTLPKTLRLDLDQPDQDTLVFSPKITVSGKSGSKNTILITTDTDDYVIESKPDGSFSTEIELDEGINRIKVANFDPTGETKSEDRTVYFSKEKI